MITTEKMLKHMAWANSQVLSRIVALTDEALDAYVTNPAWTVREITSHLVRSAHFYGYRLQMKSLQDLEEGEEKRNRYLDREYNLGKSADVATLVTALSEADATLLQESRFDDGIVYREVEGKIIERSRSTIIFQAVHHATEHRAQLVSALESGGFSTISLDDFDLWAFADEFGE